MSEKERNLNAAQYSARVTLARQRAEKSIDRKVKRLFAFAVGFWVFALALALLVG